MLYFSNDQFISLFKKIDEQLLKSIDYKIVDKDTLTDEQVLFLAIILFNDTFYMSESDFITYYLSNFNSEVEFNNIKTSLIDKNIIAIHKGIISINTIHLIDKNENTNYVIKMRISTIIKCLIYLSDDLSKTISYYIARGNPTQITSLLEVIEQYDNKLANELTHIFSDKIKIFEHTNQAKLKFSSIKTGIGKIKQSQSLLITLLILSRIIDKLSNHFMLLTDLAKSHHSTLNDNKITVLITKLRSLVNNQFNIQNFDFKKYAETCFNDFFLLLQNYNNSKLLAIKNDMLKELQFMNLPEENIISENTLKHKFFKPLLAEVLNLVKSYIDDYCIQLQYIHRIYDFNNFLAISKTSLFFKPTNFTGTTSTISNNIKTYKFHNSN